MASLSSHSRGRAVDVAPVSLAASRTPAGAKTRLNEQRDSCFKYATAHEASILGGIVDVPGFSVRFSRTNRGVSSVHVAMLRCVLGQAIV